MHRQDWELPTIDASGKALSEDPLNNGSSIPSSPDRVERIKLLF